MYLSEQSLLDALGHVLVRPQRLIQGYLAHKKLILPRTLQWPYALGPAVVLGLGQYFTSEVLVRPQRLPERESALNL